MVSSVEHCLICQSPTKSLHFQVNSCRACATFFRRSIKAKLVYHCQRGTGRCDLRAEGNAKRLCRYCRMKRCVEIGMRIDDDPETEPTTSSTYTDSSDDHFIETFDRSPITIEGNKVKYDSNHLMEAVKTNLTKDYTYTLKSPPGVILSPLQRMCHELTTFLNHKAPNPSDVNVTPHFNVSDNIRFHEEYILRLVRVVTASQQFVKIDNSQKFNVFRHFWATFFCLERAFQSITLFGHNETDMRILITNTRAIDLKPIFGKPHHERKDDHEHVRLFQPMMDRYFMHLVNPMKALRITAFEFSFVASNLLWSLFEVNGMTPETQEIAKEVLERNAAEMHSYYIYEMKLPNYAARLVALAGFVPVLESIIRSKKDLLIIGKFMDIRKFDFFDCELME